MNNSLEFVSINVGGSEYAGWKSVSVQAAARSPERTFQVTGSREDSPAAFAALLGSAPDFKPGDPCTVTSNRSLLVTGYINDVEIEMDANKHEIRITGKSKGQDVIKNSLDHKTHEWRKKNTLQIAQDTDLAGVGFSTDEDLEEHEVVRAQVGEPQGNLLDRLCRLDRMCMTGQPDGSVLLTRHGKHWHEGGIIEGQNFLRGVAKFSDDKRHAKVKVKGHKAITTGKPNFRFEGEAEDPGARQGTMKVIVPRTAVTRQQAKDMAQQAIDHRFGDGTSLQCEIQGFRDQRGQLWMPGWMVWCEVPSCGLAQELAIDNVNFTQDHMSVAKLSLVHPSALGASKGKGNKSGKWNRNSGNFQWRNNRIGD